MIEKFLGKFTLFHLNSCRATHLGDSDCHSVHFAPIMEPKSGIEPETSSLPRKCSTPELFGPIMEEEWSGLTDSNRQQPPWKGGTLPIELSPLALGALAKAGPARGIALVGVQ